MSRNMFAGKTKGVKSKSAVEYYNTFILYERNERYRKKIPQDNERRAETDVESSDREGAATTERTESAETDDSQNGE